MAYVVTKNCVDCKYGDCVDVCPVNCFYQGDSMLYINPDECIDCEACVPECPVDAIFSDADTSDEWIDKNADFDYDEDKRVTSKEDVIHGPNYKET